MSTSFARSSGPIHLGLDTSKNTILVGVLRPDEVSPDAEKIFNDEASVRRLVDRFADRSALRVCYEAGPTGFGLYRLLWAGELTAIRVPTEAEEAVRDLCRA